jgi:hypothetical protein
MFESKIEEGQVYAMSNFSVVPESGFYRTTLQPYKLVFQTKTQLKLSESCDVPELGLSFTNIVDAGNFWFYWGENSN